MAASSSRSNKNNFKYWDAQLYALELELSAVTKSFPMTKERIKQLGEAIAKVDSTVGYKFQCELKNEESDLSKWGQVIAFLKVKPMAVSPVWNTLLSRLGEEKGLLETRDKLEKAYNLHNKREQEKLEKTNIVGDIEKMVEQVTHILQQNPSAKGYINDLAPYLNKMYQLDCTFRRSNEQFQNAVESLQRENNKRNTKHEKDMEKIQKQLQDQSDKYNKVLKLLQERDGGARDALETSQKEAKKEATHNKLLRDMMNELKGELTQLRISRSEEISKMVNQELKKVSDEMSDVKRQNAQLLEQNETILKKLDKFS